MPQPSRDPVNEVWDFRAYMRSVKKHYDPAIAGRYLHNAWAKATDKELKAKAAFKLAETQLYTGYASSEHYYTGELKPNTAQESRKYWYDELKKLNDTEYFNEVIEECGYFEAYVRMSSN